MSEGNFLFGHKTLFDRNGLEINLRAFGPQIFFLATFFGLHLCLRVLAEILAKICAAVCWPKFWAATIMKNSPPTSVELPI